MGGPRGESQWSRAARAGPPSGTSRSLDPLPNTRSRPSSPWRSARRQPDHLGDAGPGAVEQLEEGPVPQVGGPGAAAPSRAGRPPGPRRGPWAAGGAGGASAGRRWGRRRWSPPPPGSGTARAARWSSGPSTPDAGPGSAARPGGARWPRCPAASGSMPASAAHRSQTGDVAPVGGQGVARPPLLHGQPGQVLLGAGGEGLAHGAGPHRSGEPGAAGPGPRPGWWWRRRWSRRPPGRRTGRAAPRPTLMNRSSIPCRSRGTGVSPVAR